MRLFDQEVLQNRAQDLGPLNGLKLVFVDLEPPAGPTHALLRLEFHNGNFLGGGAGTIEHEINVNGASPSSFFSIGESGGGAGQDGDRVRVVQVASGPGSSLRLRVQPIGGYSTYTLRIRPTTLAGDPMIDPLFTSLDFKFRPGCFNVNCQPEWTEGEKAVDPPVIDYLAKDFHSFKHVLINAMRERVPDWEPTSEADLDQVLIDLIAADGDELSDFQDRVVNEAYLGSARKRVSLARHARLMDYHVHQGNQASTRLVVSVSSDLTLPADFGVWTGEEWDETGAVIFTTDRPQACFALLNELALYTWSDAVTALEAGGTQADLALPAPLDPADKSDADALRDLLDSDDVRHLVIEEKLNPETGRVNGRDTSARQLLRLDDGRPPETVFDPLGGTGGEYLVRVSWRLEDRLKRRFCFVTRCSGEPATVGVSAFHANVVRATHGRPHQAVFRPAGEELGPSDDSQLMRLDEEHYEETGWGAVCALPGSPLAYRATPPGGEAPVRTTLTVAVSGSADPWDEQSDLIESEADAEHFIVETDEYAVSRIRFGNGVNGRALPDDAVVGCRYQVGGGTSGNVGLDSLTGFQDPTPLGVESVRNPFDVTDGRDPEEVAEILRRVPLAYRSRQLRAVTLEDYAARAEELSGVSHAKARYAWTGSWRTVRVAIDPHGTTVLSEALRSEIAEHLEAVRLIGEDLEVRPARYVALDVKLRLCAHPDYWPEDLGAELEMEFSDGYTQDGRPGFFHPDEWTFGQPLYASQLVGRALSVTGVDRVLSVSMRRWNAGAGPTTSVVIVDPDELPEATVDKLEVEPFEVILVANDPDRLEDGRILFDVAGGRQ